jgi:hypothetical protein
MTPYVSRYRRILVIASLVRAWSCVEGRVRNPLLALPFGAAPGTSQGIPGPFSFKRALPNMDNVCAGRTDRADH